MAPVDLILVEGFKMDALPKIEVHRAALGKPRLWPEAPGIVAVATDGNFDGLPCLDINDAERLADWISSWMIAGIAAQERPPPLLDVS